MDSVAEKAPQWSKTKEAYRREKEENARAKVRRAGAESGDLVEVFYRKDGVRLDVPLVGIFRTWIINENGRENIARFYVGNSEQIRIRNLASIRLLNKSGSVRKERIQ